MIKAITGDLQLLFKYWEYFERMYLPKLHCKFDLSHSRHLGLPPKNQPQMCLVTLTAPYLMVCLSTNLKIKLGFFEAQHIKVFKLAPHLVEENLQIYQLSTRFFTPPKQLLGDMGCLAGRGMIFLLVWVLS